MTITALALTFVLLTPTTTPIPTPTADQGPDVFTKCIPAQLIPPIPGRHIYCCYSWRGLAGWFPWACVTVD